MLAFCTGNFHGRREAVTVADGADEEFALVAFSCWGGGVEGGGEGEGVAGFGCGGGVGWFRGVGEYGCGC